MRSASQLAARIGIALVLVGTALPTLAEEKDALRQEITDLAGKAHRPFASEESKAAVFVFVSTDCPIANTYQPELRRLAIRFGEKGVSFFQVHCDPDLTDEAARKHARDFEITSPVILDRKQELVRRLQARITPEAFVVTPDGKTAYRGRIDNRYETWGKKRPKATVHDLAAALDAVLAGKRVAVPRTDAVGCEIYLEKSE